MSDVVSKVIALGASAGGLSAVEEFFRTVPDESTPGFVLVQHLSPNYKSLMRELLGGYTNLPIEQVQEGMKIRPGRIYLIPAGKLMTLQDHVFQLRPRDEKEMPINTFLKSLAKDFGKDAVSVILSGTGTDGTEGSKAIAEAGGLVIAQDPESAEFPSMPQNIIRRKLNHAVLRPREMWSFIENSRKDQAGIHPPANAGETDTMDQSPYSQIFSFLNTHYSIDFSHYKVNSVHRRIERRMNQLQIKAVPEYLDQLQKNQGELEALYRDLLIGVTAFFRDADVYEALATQILRPALSARDTSEDFRIWVAGCASGEEAYSLAILADEIAGEVEYKGAISVFATDLHADSVRRASSGIYSKDNLGSLSQERLQRYFKVTNDGRFKISPTIRQRVVFAQHNVLEDPPFTRIDLVTCRNLLIYFKNEAQDIALRSFHYSLRNGGTLLLGNSESLGSLESGFKTISSRHKLFRKTQARAPGPQPAQLFSNPIPTHPKPVSPQVPSNTTMASVDRNLLKVYDLMLKNYAPAGVLITHEREVRHYFGEVARFLAPLEGRVERDFLHQLEGDLKLAVSSALQRVLSKKRSVRSEGISCTTRHGEEVVDVTVRPFTEGEDDLGLVLVTFDSRVRKPEPTAEVGESFRIEEGAQNRILMLEDELRSTKENLQATVEELQTSNEELQAINEEVQVSNEELQSTNEELHSMNEELFTVNAELEQKNQQLISLNEDHENLLTNTEDGILYIDRNKRIKKFNPSIAFAFNLLPQDVGRPIDHIAYNLEGTQGMLTDVENVLQTGARKEREMKTRSGTSYLRRITPIFDADREVNGVVLTFTDITESSQMKSRLSRAMTMAKMAWWEWDLETDRLDIHAEGECILGYACDQVEKTSDFWLECIHPEDREQVQKSLDDCVRGTTQEWICEHRYARAGTDPVVWEWVYETGSISRRAADGRPLEMSGTTVNIHDRKLMELDLLRSKEKAEEGLRVKNEFLSMMSHEIRTPLNGICGVSNLIAREVKNPQLQEYISIIKSCSDSLLALIDGILDFSKAEYGRLELNLRSVSIRKILQDVVRVTSGKARENKITIETQIQTAQDEFYLDDLRLRQILLNVVGNAVKFSKDGGKVQISAKSEDPETLVFSVKDQGIGIDPKFAKDLFEPFRQQDGSSTRKYGGVGLGLAISKKLVERMGGQIHISSVEEEGTTVVFSVQVGDISKDSVDHGNAEAKSGTILETGAAKKPGASAAKILVVDDDSSNLLVQKTILEKSGFKAETADCLDSALRRLRESDGFSAALVDLHMPEGSGYDLFKAIREGKGGDHNSTIPLFACTADASKSAAHKVKSLGFNGIIIKPIKLDELRQMIKPLLPT